MQARREWISLLGEHTLPFSYVPVNNIISRDGEEALTRSMPSIRVIAGLRAGISQETFTEFAPHPTHPEIYYIPRSSWGYLFGAFEQSRVVSGLAAEGIWCHFIHPDDIFDETRSGGRNWEELRAGFQSMIDFVERHYPWIRFVTVKEAYQELLRIDAAGAEYRWEDGALVIASEPGMLFRVRLNHRSLADVRGARILHEYKRPSAIIVEITEPEARISFR